MMKISQSQVHMLSEHRLEKQHIQQESIRSWIGDAPQRASEGRLPPKDAPAATDRVSLSTEAYRQRFQAVSEQSPEISQPNESDMEEPKLRAMRLILEALTGKKINIAQLEKLETNTSPARHTSNQEVSADEQQRAGWGLEYDYYEQKSEQEELFFRSDGFVQTSDGQKIEFDVQLTMKREFLETNSLHIRAGDALLIDPLVINFSGKATELTDLKFTFDLDADGVDDEINFVRPGSGFLFFDRNNDGLVNDGSELFGPASGSGFKELAGYDGDGNNWLDENDPIFDKLKIWMKDSGGNDSIMALSSKNIGAIFLGSETTPFSLTGPNNNLLGQVTHTSIFLKENGQAGTIQEINLTV